MLIAKVETRQVLDRFMPAHQFSEYHQALALAPLDRLFAAAQNLDMGRSPLVGGLMLLRELPFRLSRRDFRSPGLGRSFEQLQAFGFILLAHEPSRELVLGLVGQFWSPRPVLRRLPPDEFAAFAEPGFAKVAANLLVEPLGPGLSRISTETRVQCLGPKALARFRAYWCLIRPFSGLIRREWLRLARQEAERTLAGGIAQGA